MVSGMTQTEPRTVADLIARIDAANVPTEMGDALFGARQSALASLAVELADAVRPGKQTEIDQRETARVEAILQVAKWALQEAAAYTAPSLRCVRYLAAIQHDADPGLEAFRHGLVSEGLDTLAEHWDGLPAGERDVVLAGILGDLGPDRAGPWSELIHRAELLKRTDRDIEPETRTQYERGYARQLRSITTAVVGS